MARSTTVPKQKEAEAVPYDRVHLAAVEPAHDSPQASRYNIIVTSTGNGPVASPEKLVVPYGYGMGEPWPSPAFIKWYIMPGTGDVTFNPANGISFHRHEDFPEPTVHYNTDHTTASVEWTNDGSFPGAFSYDINVVVNGREEQLDPDVENQAPPGIPPGKKRVRKPRKH